MRLLLYSILHCLPFLSFGQLTFEHVHSPKDFSIGAVRKSPLGEYFVQAADDRNSIYTSLDGIDWTRTSLPVGHELYEIQFFDDGTPVLKPENEAHLIRRNGIWYTMKAGGGNKVETSFVKGDTLFMYYDNSFSYSLDKGQTFITVCTYDGNLVDHTARLWKFESYYVLHHTAGAQDRLSVFNLNGERVLSDTLDINFSTVITYNSCGQVLFNDEENYYLLTEAGLTYQTGQIADIVSQFHDDTDLLSEGGHYYTREENTIYKTDGCNFDWEFLNANELIESKEHIWFDHQGEIYLYDTYADYFSVQKTQVTAEEHYPDITHPHVTDIDESQNGFQFSLTTNGLFNKNIGDENWIELDSSGTIEYHVQYSPRGDLYISRKNDILYSTDNGLSFSTIQLPSPGYPLRNYTIEVLDDNLLFLIPGSIGHNFYTLNNGVDWIDLGSFGSSDATQAKLVGDDILIADIGYVNTFTKISLMTNEITSESFDHIPGTYTLDSEVAILDDGTVYFKLELFDGNGLYRYRFGEGLKYLGPFSELEYTNISSSGNDLYAFGSNSYYLLSGESFSHQHYYNGLPTSSSKGFIIAKNQYLYVIVNNSNIYRTAQPLSLPTSISNTGALVDFNIFPNPAKNELTLTIDESILSRIDSYEISDQLGRILDHSEYLNKHAINVSHLNAGLYNLILKDKERMVGIKKFIKL